jgi:cytochrome c2
MNAKFRTLTIVLVVAFMFAALFSVAGCAADEPAADEPTGGTAEEPAAEEPTANDEGQQAFEEVCTTCHDGTRVFLQPDGTDWSRVIDTMEEAHGAVLTSEQKASVQRYLEEYQQTTGEQIISGKCTDCHDMSNIYLQPQGASWEDITRRMIEEHEVALTPEEQQAVIDYLSHR